MGRRGPKPKPTALRVFEGNPSRKPLGGDAPMLPPASSLEPPTSLGRFGVARWRELAPGLASAGLLTELDLPAFEVYCGAWDMLGDAEAAIVQYGYTLTGARGAIRLNPAVRLRAMAIDTLRTFGRCFGLTPADRAGLRVHTACAVDELIPLSRPL